MPPTQGLAVSINSNLFIHPMNPSTYSRRKFIQTTGIATAAIATVSEELLADSEKPSLIIDCHAHIYGEDENKYPTRDDPYRPPSGTGTVSHLKRQMKANGVSYVTAIQTGSYYQWDNRFTSDSARDHSDFMAGVVTLDPDNPYSPEMMKYYVSRYNVRGMRSVPARSGLLDDPGVDGLWSMAEDLGIVINVLVNRDKRPEIESLVERHPKLRIVIDHCLNLKADENHDATLEAVVALAQLPNAHAKLTFIPTGTNEPYPCRDLHDTCKTVIKAFTPRRCVWGSDFPTELWCPNITYAQHLRIFTHELGLDEQSKKAILGETAHRLWFKARI